MEREDRMGEKSGDGQGGGVKMVTERVEDSRVMVGWECQH